jgi:hypothetical protein
MPLLDHFHPPLSVSRTWTAFYTHWAAALHDELNRVLPARFLAEMVVRTGPYVVGALGHWRQERPSAAEGTGTASTANSTWAPPAATQTVSLRLPDEIEVQVYDLEEASRLLAAVVLVSPSNKENAAERQLFAGKCVDYLHL